MDFVKADLEAARNEARNLKSSLEDSANDWLLTPQDLQRLLLDI